VIHNPAPETPSRFNHFFRGSNGQQTLFGRLRAGRTFIISGGLLSAPNMPTLNTFEGNASYPFADGWHTPWWITAGRMWPKRGFFRGEYSPSADGSAPRSRAADGACPYRLVMEGLT